MSGSWRTLELAKEDGVATVVLNRPGRLNAYDVEMRDELWELTDWLSADPGVSACVFTGAGRAFCSGADLAEFGTAPSVVTARMIRRNRPVWTRILELPQVTIAALHGYVLGAGLELALACDLRFVARDALLGMPETGLGFVPPAGGTQLLPRTIGVGLAKRMLYTRERLGAEDALRIGLASRLADDRRATLDEAREAAHQAALMPTAARTHLKAALRLH